VVKMPRAEEGSTSVEDVHNVAVAGIPFRPLNSAGKNPGVQAADRYFFPGFEIYFGCAHCLKG
jgi:hypothetical protein